MINKYFPNSRMMTNKYRMDYQLENNFFRINVVNCILERIIVECQNHRVERLLWNRIFTQSQIAPS